jgi:hypothetical protein
MRQEDAARVVLVRAFEETLPHGIAGETLLEAHAAAGDPAAGPRWIECRAAYLLDHALSGHRTVVARAQLGLPGPWLSIGVAVLAGLVSNYLGPSAEIHVVLNPIVVLIAWNLAVYAALALVALRPAARAREPRSTGGRGRLSDLHDRGLAPDASRRRGLAERLLLGRARAWLLGARARLDEGIADARQVAAVAQRFAILWWPIVRPAVGLWLRRLLHLCAIGLAAGAVAGMYVRGLFFAYRVVWRSTFVNDPGVVAWILRGLVGPAALALGRPLPSTEDVVRLLGTDGDPAGPWIHLYAVTALAFVVAPRALLALATTRRLRRATREVAVDLEDDYYCDLLQKARAVSPEELEAAVRDAVRDECGRFGDRLAAFVCAKLYDGRLAPRLWSFREHGGTLRGLEEALRRECETFGPVLERELPSAQRDLEGALVGRVRRLLGEEGALETRPPGDLVGEVGAASARTATQLGERVSGDVATVVAAVVSTAVAIVAGTVSGGFGKALGVALLVGIVKSGPVGWVVGAVGGLVAAGSAFWLGRETVREGVKGVSLPAAVLKLALWHGRYTGLVADGRARCEAAIREALDAQMTPLAAAIADHVWNGLKPVVGELQRPRVTGGSRGDA